MLRRSFLAACSCFLALLPSVVLSADPPPTVLPLLRTVDMNIGESAVVELSDGRNVLVKLLDLQESRDQFREAVRRAVVKVEIDGKVVSLVSANYRLPYEVGFVQIDCPITKGYCQNNSQSVAGQNPWGLEKGARLRLWPAGSPWINPGTFMYPAKQRWFASLTQMANEPTYVDGGEDPQARSIYYHYGLDIGGSEGMVDVVAATNGLVVSLGTAVMPGFEDSPVKPRYDVIYLRDERGWYYRYSHLQSFDKLVRIGQPVKMGQKIGVLGKEGGSGGWSHLHFDISARQPSGKWGIVEGYAFLFEAYLQQYQPRLLAIARPHHLAAVSQPMLLDGSRSWSSTSVVRYDWIFTDGTKANGAVVERTYDKPGMYSEILKITDATGRIDYDFAVVDVIDAQRTHELPPSIHANYAPTFGIRPGDPVTFKVRTFRTSEGKETWDFGDGSPQVEVKSDGNAVKLAKDGYAQTVHRFAAPGHYIVRVQRTDDRGVSAIGHLQVRVGVE
jgi:murein DD-endopeptidase MepM/ murein hydrolase activator NlpD